MLARRIETNKFHTISCNKILLLIGGFDTPFAIATGYSTTDYIFIKEE